MTTIKPGLSTRTFLFRFISCLAVVLLVYALVQSWPKDILQPPQIPEKELEKITKDLRAHMESTPPFKLCAELKKSKSVSSCNASVTSNFVDVITDAETGYFCYQVQTFLQYHRSYIRFEPGYILRIFLPSNIKQATAACPLPVFD